MIPFIDTEIILLFAIGILAVLTLASPRPSLSGTLLFFESILITLVLIEAYGIDAVVIGVSLLLTFFSMLLIGINYYFEISFHRAPSRFPKVAMALGALLLMLFVKNCVYLKELIPDHPNEGSLSFYEDSFIILMIGFALFTILASALTIFELKNPKSGESA